jgi:hypothetical protein
MSLMQVPFLNILVIIFVRNVYGHPLGMLKFKRRIELHSLSFDLSVINNIITNFFNAQISCKH